MFPCMQPRVKLDQKKDLGFNFVLMIESRQRMAENVLRLAITVVSGWV